MMPLCSAICVVVVVVVVFGIRSCQSCASSASSIFIGDFPAQDVGRV